MDFGRVHDTGLDYVVALEDIEEHEVARAMDKTAKCLAKYTQTLRVTKETLWTMFACDDLKMYPNGAEEKVAEVESADVKDFFRKGL